MVDQNLARRAVACKHWRWLQGMSLTRQGARLAHQSDLGRWLVSYGADSLWCDPAPDWLPDLDDPATVGCLLSLVREAWEPHRGSDYLASTMHTGSGWGVVARYGSEGMAAIVLPTYDSEAEALVAALEAAP